MEGKGILATGGAIAITIWLVLSFSASHDYERQETHKKIERDQSEFDRDFARMTAAPADQAAALAKRAEETGAAYAKVQAEAKARQELEQAKRDEVQAGYEKEINLDAEAVRQRLAETKAKAATLAAKLN